MSEIFESEYQTACAAQTDINLHLPYLRQLAAGRRVTEFGVRWGGSTRAFLAAAPKRLVSYDLALNPGVEALFAEARAGGMDASYIQANVLAIPPIEDTDLLFIDTLHTGIQVTAELARHAQRAKLIAFHDVETFGWVGEDGSDGLLRPILTFMAAQDWRPHYYSRANNGLLVIERS